MKIPEKIYLYPYATDGIYEVETKSLEGTVEYIRADALEVKEVQEESVSEDKMTISKEWFEHCKKSWYNEGYIDGEHNRDRQFEEPVSEELEEVISYLGKRYPEVSFAKLSRIAIYVAKWKEEQLKKNCLENLI